MVSRFNKLTLLLIGGIIWGLGLLCLTGIGEAQTDEEQAKAREIQREMIRTAKEQLEGTSWEIILTESTTKKNKEVINDTLRFVNGKVESEKLILEGFSPSNYTVRVKRGREVIWETMQKGEEGIAFWRGELDRDKKDGTLGSVMRGVLSWHKDNEGMEVVDYTFVSKAKEEITPETTSKPEVAKEEEVTISLEEVEAEGVAEEEMPSEPSTGEEVQPVVKD